MLIDGSPVRVPERAAETREDFGAPARVVNHYIAPAPERHLPHMLIATTLVAVLPLATSLALRASGAISGWLSVGLAVTMSLATSVLGSAYWRKRGGHGEVLFSELLLWGWIRSWRQERELANATRLLDLVNPDATHIVEPDELSVERREHLLRQLAGALEGQDIYLNGHSRRVARHATMIARGMGLSNEEVARVRAAAAVHDVGKLRTPKAILNKPGRLTDEEFEVIKRHPVDGAEMVAALGDPELTRIVRHHHERLDGAGYPCRLRGEDIPLGARIIAVADTFDAITSARPYRAAARHQKAIDILRKQAGSQLDPEAVRAFLAYYSGNRPAVVWAVITSSVRRFVSWLTGDPAAAATISASKVAAATVATAAIGVAAGAAPVPTVHHVPRPLAAHSVPARPRGVTLGLHRSGARIVVPANSAPRATHTVASAPSRSPRGAAHHPSVLHSHVQAGVKHAHRQAHPAHVPSTAPSSTAAPASSGAKPSWASVGAQGTGERSVSVAGTSRPANSAPASHSQGSSATGNAYGHTKPLGNGHGNGVAAGYANPKPNPSPSASGHANGATANGATANRAAHANANASVPATVPNNAANQSSPAGNNNSGGDSEGNSNSQGAARAGATQGSQPAAAGQTSDGHGDKGNGSSGQAGNGNG